MKSIIFTLVGAACAATAAWAADAPPGVGVDLKNAAGASVGRAQVTEAPNGVLVRIEAKGLTPGWHGLHFHEKGDCSKADFTSAGGHVHAKATIVHGLLNTEATEAGDLPNLYVGADGTATVELFSTYVSLAASGRPALADADGSAIVIHANPDDYRTQPIGGAGARIACGVIAPKG
ncbi:superoxide dismutase[Cu-Zn] [Phenylobacterium sp.]|jgi:Cu-Zn family superoxide dismutase|uniref:superoxide dismutase[Cu-Zn] n=1 Tax=Phenylobacterium sp. TaxID=1871053 RepID=UPI002F3ED011